jgi:hypothetical protein
VTQAVEAAPSKPLRVIFIFVSLPSALARLDASFGGTALVRKVGYGGVSVSGGNQSSSRSGTRETGNETILGNPRNRPETERA